MRLHASSYAALFAAAVASVATSAPEPDWTVTAVPFERIVTLTEQAPNATCEANIEATQQANTRIEISWAEGTPVDSEDAVDVEYDAKSSGTKQQHLLYGPPEPSTVTFRDGVGSQRLVVGLKARPKTTFPVSVRCVFAASFSGDDDQPANARIVFSAP